MNDKKNIGSMKNGSTVNIENGFAPITIKSTMHKIVTPVRSIIVFLSSNLLFFLLSVYCLIIGGPCFTSGATSSSIILLIIIISK